MKTYPKLKKREEAYEAGKSYTSKDGTPTFWGYRYPLDLLPKGPVWDGSFHVASCDGKTKSEKNSTIIYSSQITIKKKLQIHDLINDAIEYIRGRIKYKVSGHDSVGDNSGFHEVVSSEKENSFANSEEQCGIAAISGDRGLASAAESKSIAAATGFMSAAKGTGVDLIAAATGNEGAAIVSGDGTAAVTSGLCSAAASTGIQSAAVSVSLANGAAASIGGNTLSGTTGDGSMSTVEGSNSIACASGANSHAEANGWNDIAASSGTKGVAIIKYPYSVSVATGNFGGAVANAPASAAIAWGICGKAKGVVGSYLIFAEWGEACKDGLNNVIVVKVDGEKIKENTWYTVRNGELVEAYATVSYASKSRTV